MTAKTRSLNEERRALVTEATDMMDRLHRVGFHATGQKMHEVVRQIGFEWADIIITQKKAEKRRGRNTEKTEAVG